MSGWLPYWAKQEGAVSLEGHLKLFDEINPFAFEVTSQGTLYDATRIEESPWPELVELSREAGTQMIPSVIWTDSVAMHKTFSDGKLLQAHLEEIMKVFDDYPEYEFPGVDIDYEGKDVADKDLFTNFIRLLAKRLHKRGKKLSCTIEARTTDEPPKGFEGVRAMSFANDLPALAELCDEVRVMAYDQVFQEYRANPFIAASPEPFAPNAASDWTEAVIQNMLKYVPPEVLVLGVPTYGWEFQFTEAEGGFEYTRYRSISFPAALELAASHGVRPKRNSGGELDYVYLADDGSRHIVNFSDAAAIRQKLKLAEKYQLKGVSIFKLDGLTDPELFPVVREFAGG